LPEKAAAAGSVLAQAAFLDDALVRLAHALDAVLRLAAGVRKRDADNRVDASCADHFVMVAPKGSA